MNRKLVMTLAVSGALAGLAGGVYAQDAPKPESGKPELQQLVPQLEIALPWFIAEGDEKKDAPKPELIAEGDDDKKDAPKPELIAEGDDDKKDAPKPELMLS